jgi:NAD(P)-dependent dehydrogenase (short-subunit alcohol dehydrogenase family)
MTQKIALVTGSTSGIGKETAQLLLNKGMKVIISSEKDLDKNYVKETFDHAENAEYFKLDISNKNDLEAVATYIKNKHHKLDYLVANAGIMPKPCGIDDITDDVIDKTINTNLKGTFWTLKILGNLIKDTSDSGAIVCLTSVDGLIGEPYGVIYSTTKAGIISLTKSFSRYFKEPLVRVNAIAPGLIDTPLTASSGEDPAWTTDFSVIQRMGTPKEIASGVAFLLSDDAAFITGQIIAIDGGFTLK